MSNCLVRSVGHVEPDAALSSCFPLCQVLIKHFVLISNQSLAKYLFQLVFELLANFFVGQLDYNALESVLRDLHSATRRLDYSLFDFCCLVLYDVKSDTTRGTEINWLSEMTQLKV